MSVKNVMVCCVAFGLYSTFGLVSDQAIAPLSDAVGGAPCNHSDFVTHDCQTQPGAPENCTEKVQTYPGFDPQIWLDVRFEQQPICTGNMCVNHLWWKRVAHEQCDQGMAD